MKLSSGIVLFSLFLVGAEGSAQGTSRQAAAGPAEILAGRLRLPATETVAARSQAALVPVEFVTDADGRWSWEGDLPLARAGTATLVLLGADVGAWELSVAASSTPPAAGERARAAALAWDRLAGETARADQIAPGLVASRFELRVRTPRITHLRVRHRDRPEGAPLGGLLLIGDTAPVEVESFLGDWSLLADEPPTVLARVRADDDQPDPDEPRLETARVFVQSRGETAVVTLLDDGRQGDGQAGDGLWGARLPRGLTGIVSLRVESLGRLADGSSFLRTTTHAVPIQQRVAGLEGTAVAQVEGDQWLAIDVGAWSLVPKPRLQLTAEVWGRRAGHLVPVAWLARILRPVATGNGTGFARLWLDGRWLALAEVDGPLELRNVRLQDPATHVVHGRLERIELPATSWPSAAFELTDTITPDMQSLVVDDLHMQPLAGEYADAGPPLPVPESGSLMLVHGYCSSGSPWPSGDFSDPKLVFSDPDANRSHDHFARLIRRTGRNERSWGVIAHSQGGPAALQLLTYYVSGLGRAQGGRRIQSVGSPYQGTPLASLGDLLPGVGCGVNFDLTPEGSALWLAGIPSWARANVSFWSTSDPGGLFSWCQFATELVLSDPEDGVVEMFRADLPGANSMGHVTGWCHTSGMDFPAQTSDASRNADMNANAAR